MLGLPPHTRSVAARPRREGVHQPTTARDPEPDAEAASDAEGTDSGDLEARSLLPQMALYGV